MRLLWVFDMVQLIQVQVDKSKEDSGSTDGTSTTDSSGGENPPSQFSEADAQVVTIQVRI
jgi:hypothetical protein